MSDKLNQYHALAKQEEALTTAEKKQLLSSLDAKSRARKNWGVRVQWALTCCALVTLALFSWQYHNREVSPLYALSDFQSLQVFDLAQGQQRVRISQTIPLHLNSIEQAEKELANALQNYRGAHATSLNAEYTRVAKVIHDEGDWLLGDCKQQILIALSEPLVEQVLHFDINQVEAPYIQLKFDANGTLLAMRPASSSSCSSI